ncbi:DUF4132 domain-containing protein [Actinoplanes solisilvae]|uniref:DUF4132 domain-containing protein n=1 Tax=Actinoplanes solisilvae TaxID=2486853 RepID=UPI000FD840F4|nr:DUF4132 domain-containing protein [Actinoplanes solisilvae]
MREDDFDNTFLSYPLGMMPAMDDWLPLIPGPIPGDRAVWKAASDERRLDALRWHQAITSPRRPYYAAIPPIYDMTAEPVPWHTGDLDWALHAAAKCGSFYDGRVYHLPAVIASQLPLDELAPYQPILQAVLSQIAGNRDMPLDIRRPLTERYGQVLARLAPGMPVHLLAGHDAFGPAARRRLGARVADPAVIAAIGFATTLSKLAPAKSWLREAEAVNVPSAARDVLAAFADTAVTVWADHDFLLRGLCWMAALDPGDETTALLARVAEVAGEPSGRSADPRASRTAAAAVEILVDRPGDEPARALARLSVTVRSKPLRNRVRAAIDRMGVDLEVAVEEHDLGRSWPTPGGHTLTVEIVGEKAVVLCRPLKSLPAAAREHAAEPKALAKQVNRTLAAERVRLEDLLTQDRTWSWETWHERYLRHPVTGTIARRLLWEASPDGLSWKAGLPELTGELGGPGWTVRLWHPVLAGAAEVVSWRDQITEAGLRQPFKQAFREVYRLTPAEEQTGVYSNRFAAHILRYRQAGTLMRVRGWSAPLLGSWDGGSHSSATRELAAGTWQASLEHMLADRVAPPNYQVEYCTTDQVRFARREGRRWHEVALAEVPPRVLSEAMRDVDLFVGVTSIAADDAWADRGDHPFGGYWQSAGFGELTGAAEVRRDVLARLLPRLAIGSRCELTERFLRVRGTRASYLIHLGSGNVLIEPNAYLCIVAGQRPARVALPFDDDERLSLILSKAFLLAADDKITDRSILRQLP